MLQKILNYVRPVKRAVIIHADPETVTITIEKKLIADGRNDSTEFLQLMDGINDTWGLDYPHFSLNGADAGELVSALLPIVAKHRDKSIF